MDDIKLLITAGVNAGASIGEINRSIKALQKKVNTLNLKVNINNNALKQIEQFNRRMKDLGDQALNTKKVIEETMNPDGSRLKRTFYDDGSIAETTKATRKLNEETSKGLQIDKEREKALQYEQRVRASLAKQEQNNREKALRFEQQARKNISQEDVKLAEQMASGRERINEQTRNRERQWQESQRRAVNENAERERQQIRTTQQERDKYVNWWQQQARNIEVQERKNLELQRQQNKELSQRVNQFRQNRLNEASRLEQQHGGSMDERTRRQFDAYVTSLQRLDSTMPQVERRMRNLQTGFDGIRTHAMNATRELNNSTGALDNFGHMMMRIPLWAAGMTLLYAPLRGFQDMVTQIIEIDTQMTALRRVSGGEISQDHILRESAELAERLGNTISQINEGS